MEHELKHKIVKIVIYLRTFNHRNVNAIEVSANARLYHISRHADMHIRNNFLSGSIYLKKLLYTEKINSFKIQKKKIFRQVYSWGM